MGLGWLRERDGRRRWDSIEKYKMLQVFDGNPKGFEEWAVKAGLQKRMQQWIKSRTHSM